MVIQSRTEAPGFVPGVWWQCAISYGDANHANRASETTPSHGKHGLPLTHCERSGPIALASATQHQRQVKVRAARSEAETRSDAPAPRFGTAL
jgi:hypothetical protein